MSDPKNRIITLINNGKLSEAQSECLAVCKKYPGKAEMWFILSAICGQMKDFPAAEKYCKKALKLNPSAPAAHYNLAVALRGQGKNDKALDSLNKAVQLQGDFTAALLELGNIHLVTSQYERAVDYYCKVINSMPNAFQAYAGIAAAQDLAGDGESAVKACIESLRINPAQQDVTLRLARLYDRMELPDNALHYYQCAIKLGYDNADVFVNIGRMYLLQDNYVEAEKYYREALSADPNSIEALTNLALIYDEKRDITKALQYIEEANKVGSNDERFIYNYAKILTSAQQFAKAEYLYRKVLSISPGFSEAAVNLGNLYLLSGRPVEANVVYSEACKLRPDYHDACSNMLMSLNYTNTHSTLETRDMHLAWANRIESGIKRFETKRPCGDHESTITRIGYVSPDFRNHSVAYFFEGIVKFSNKDRVKNYCYSDVRNKDEVTRRLQNYADHWRDVAMMNNDSVAELIQQDGIDILVDLCGHMSGNRLPMFALKPAPVQVTYLGYPNSTGLRAMDYRIVDKYTDPVGSEEMMSELPLYVEPNFLSYTPFENCPDVSELPAINNGYVTFGSFNNLAKMSDDVINTWSVILTRTPKSKLCIKARQYADESIKSAHIKRFNQAGIDESRLELISYAVTTEEHLQSYNKIDIALDTYPYNGTTTTFEALWMGVPVVCKAGDRHASRVGVSILNNSGLDELLGTDDDAYVDIACDLASDTERLENIRCNLRSAMSTSVLLDTRAFASNIEALLIATVK